MFYKIIKILAAYSVILNFLVSAEVYARAAPEYYIKGLFLIKVLDFVQWPENSLQRNTVKMICVYGEDPFFDYQAVLGATIQQHVIFQLIDNIDNTEDCHVLYISKSEKYELKNILNSLEDKSVLTVSDIDKFAYRNGMIELSIHPRKNNIQLKINIDSVNNTDLKLSSNLIDLATKTYGNSYTVTPE